MNEATEIVRGAIRVWSLCKACTPSLLIKTYANGAKEMIREMKVTEKPYTGIAMKRWKEEDEPIPQFYGATDSSYVALPGSRVTATHYPAPESRARLVQCQVMTQESELCQHYGYTILPNEEYQRLLMNGGCAVTLNTESQPEPTVTALPYDAVRELVLKLTSTDQRKLYIWMADALGCRR